MKKILVVDDLPENVFILQDRLEKEGHRVITAYDGNSGVEKAFAENPDLILLDIMMPGLDGLEVCKILLNDKRTKQIPIILVSAKTEAQDIKQGLESGAFDYITKPFNKIELLARVHSALKLSEAHKQLIELEKRNTYMATIVTANHKIKQPLTLMNLSSSAMKRELNKKEISKEALQKHLNYIQSAIKEINDILSKLDSIEKPRLTKYTKNINMIDVDEEKKNLTD